MGSYLIVSHDRGPAAMALSEHLSHSARSNGLAVTELSPCVWLAVGGPSAPRTLAVGPWTLIGDVFNRASPKLPNTREDDPYGYERKLVARFWGRFIGVRLSGDGAASHLLREPSGALPCVTSTQNGVTVASSCLPDWLVQRLRPAWSINFQRLAASLRNPLNAPGDLPLDGLLEVSPGTVQPLSPGCASAEIWRPDDLAFRGQTLRLGRDDAADLLRSAVDETVHGLASAAPSLAAEVSGGLDSSIVASSLVQRDRDRVSLWLNAQGPTPESDERFWVTALADRLGIAVRSVPLADGPITEAALEQISGDLRPGVNALDVHHDLDWARRLTEAGCAAIMTGKGGDSVLVPATPDVFTDLWMAKGYRAVLSPDVPRLAAATEVSVWTMLRAARRHRHEPGPLPRRDPAFLTAAADDGPGHPWLAERAALGPAKTLQIAGIIDNMTRHARSLQSDVVEVFHPLCSLPVIEACLAIPAPLMTLGGRDRGLARHAFSGRLPEAIVQRPSKGDLTWLYGRRILKSLDVLRPWLLDGRLAAEGILDRAALDARLTRESLTWRGPYAEIMVAAAFEGWVRVWERRLSAAA